MFQKISLINIYVSASVASLVIYENMYLHMNPEDLQKAPKLFCENIRVGYTPEYFVMGLSSGSQAQIYSLTPGHTKRLLQYLTHEIEKFEKEHGTIEAEWNPNIISPIKIGKEPTENS